MVVKINNDLRGRSSLNEVSRSDLISKSRKGSKQRYKKRLNYQVSNFKGVDLSKLFNEDYFVFNTPVKDYVCTIAYPGVLKELKEVVKVTNGDPGRINLQMVIKALRRSFDKTNDVKVRCTCADFKYRFMYWADKNGYLYGPPTPGTEQFPEKTNPDDALGATCKHLDMFLSNKRWLTKAASVVNALIKTYPEKAAVYLYDEKDVKDNDEGDGEVTDSEDVKSNLDSEEKSVTGTDKDSGDSNEDNI